MLGLASSGMGVGALNSAIVTFARSRHSGWLAQLAAVVVIALAMALLVPVR